MPFKKTGKDTYTSPSGRKFTAKQVQAYHATDGFTTKQGDDGGMHQRTGDGRPAVRGKGGRRG